jgi:hypothetical protein
VSENLVVYSWGYGRDRTFEDLLAALPEDRWGPWRIPIIDVRRSRASRNPHWSCRNGSYPPEWKIYVWLNHLGNAQEAKRGEWLPAHGPNLMIEHLLIAEGWLRKTGAVVLVCAERDHRRCHRVQVAEALAARTGAKVAHL